MAFENSHQETSFTLPSFIITIFLKLVQKGGSKMTYSQKKQLSGVQDILNNNEIFSNDVTLCSKPVQYPVSMKSISITLSSELNSKNSTHTETSTFFNLTNQMHLVLEKPDVRFSHKFNDNSNIRLKFKYSLVSLHDHIHIFSEFLKRKLRICGYRSL